MAGVQGRVAIVTGAGVGLGRSHALTLARGGAKVVVNDIGAALDGSETGESPAETVVAEIRTGGGEAVASLDNVASPEGGASLIAGALEAFGRIDIVVNNAGILRDRTFHKMGVEEWESVLRVHLGGTFHVTHAAWPHLREQGYGRIIVTTSVTGLYGNFGQANYGAAKLGIVGLMHTLAVEGKAKNVLVNAVSPIATTRMSEAVLDREFDPGYVSALVAYLASEECTSTGEIVHAAGGRYTRVRFMQSRGVELDAVPEPGELGERWDEIMDLDGARIGALA